MHVKLMGMPRLFAKLVALLTSKRPWVRRLTTAVLLVSLLGIMTLVSWLGFEFLTHDLHHFQRTVRLGMTAEQVESELGPPWEKLEVGQPLGPWGGGGPPRHVTTETWIYYRFPMHRFALGFDDGKVVDIQDDVT